MWPAVIGQHERAPDRTMRKSLAEQVPGSVGVIVCLAGAGLAEGPGWRRQVGPGMALLFRSGLDEFQITSLPGRPLWRSLDIHLRGSMAQNAAAGLIAGRGYVHVVDPLASIWQESLAAIPGGYGHGRIWSLEQGMGYAARVLACLAAPDPGSGSSDHLVEAAVRLMREVGALRSVADIALRLDVSREHLSRRFSSAGIDAAALFRRIRIERACALLANRGLPIAEIGRTCGWRSTAAFTRAIAMATGRTPRGWRSRSRSVI